MLNGVNIFENKQDSGVDWHVDVLTVKREATDKSTRRPKLRINWRKQRTASDPRSEIGKPFCVTKLLFGASEGALLHAVPNIAPFNTVFPFCYNAHINRNRLNESYCTLNRKCSEACKA